MENGEYWREFFAPKHRLKRNERENDFGGRTELLSKTRKQNAQTNR